MKRTRSILPIVLSLALAVTTMAWSEETKDVKVEVVSVDRTKNLITMKDENGDSHTTTLLGSAIEQAKTLQPGDKVTVTWTFDEHGSPLGITLVKKNVIS